MKRVAVFTSDKYLLRRIQLELKNFARVITDTADDNSLDAVILHTEDEGGRALIVKASGEVRRIPLPCPLYSIRAALSLSEEQPRLRLARERAVYFNSHRIELTGIEYSLLRELMAGGGEFVSRERLLQSVWHADAEDGVINVYIHYLRHKLERDGEKIIISSRKSGYRIDKKYLGGDYADTY